MCIGLEVTHTCRGRFVPVLSSFDTSFCGTALGIDYRRHTSSYPTSHPTRTPTSHLKILVHFLLVVPPATCNIPTTPKPRAVTLGRKTNNFCFLLPVEYSHDTLETGGNVLGVKPRCRNLFLQKLSIEGDNRSLCLLRPLGFHCQQLPKFVLPIGGTQSRAK